MRNAIIAVALALTLLVSACTAQAPAGESMAKTEDETMEQKEAPAMAEKDASNTAALTESAMEKKEDGAMV